MITSIQNIDLTQATTQTGSQPSMLPSLVIVIIIVLGVGGYLYMKKRKNQ